MRNATAIAAPLVGTGHHMRGGRRASMMKTLWTGLCNYCDTTITNFHKTKIHCDSAACIAKHAAHVKAASPELKKRRIKRYRTALGTFQ